MDLQKKSQIFGQYIWLKSVTICHCAFVQTSFDLGRSNRLGNMCGWDGAFLGTLPFQGGEAPALPKLLGAPHYAHTVWARTTKLNILAHVGEKMHVSRETDMTPIQRGRAPAFPLIFDLLHTPRCDKQQPNFAWWSNYTKGNFYRVDHALCPGKIFVTRMLTRDLFAIAIFLSKSYHFLTQ